VYGSRSKELWTRVDGIKGGMQDGYRKVDGTNECCLYSILILCLQSAATRGDYGIAEGSRKKSLIQSGARCL
jgi:hypothetical protein